MSLYYVNGFCLKESAVNRPRTPRRRHSLSGIDIMPGDVENAIHDTYHAIHPKPPSRFLVKFRYRFKRRFGLVSTVTWLATAATHAPPLR